MLWNTSFERSHLVVYNIKVGMGVAVLLSITTLSRKVPIYLHIKTKQRFHVTVVVLGRTKNWKGISRNGDILLCEMYFKHSVCKGKADSTCTLVTLSILLYGRKKSFEGYQRKTFSDGGYKKLFFEVIKELNQKVSYKRIGECMLCGCNALDSSFSGLESRTSIFKNVKADIFLFLNNTSYSMNL